MPAVSKGQATIMRQQKCLSLKIGMEKLICKGFQTANFKAQIYLIYQTNKTRYKSVDMQKSCLLIAQNLFTLFAKSYSIIKESSYLLGIEYELFTFNDQ